MALEVTIIGLDALGQSIGLALKASPAPMNVTLHDRDHARASAAAKAGAGDRAEWNLPSAVEKADLVFINEPIHQIRQTMEWIGAEVRADAVVTDTCGIKEPVLQWAEEIFPSTVHFVGGTPLVSTKTPSPYLFQKRRYAIIPSIHTVEAAVRLVADTVTLMGAEPLFIEAAEHETLLAAVQHLPVLSGAALLQLTTQSGSWKEMASMASPAYTVATTFPTDDPVALTMMLRHNREALQHWVGALRRELLSLQELLEVDDDGAQLQSHLTRLMEAQVRWQQAEAQNPDVPSYTDSLEKANETRGFARWFGIRRRRDE